MDCESDPMSCKTYAALLRRQSLAAKSFRNEIKLRKHQRVKLSKRNPETKLERRKLTLDIKALEQEFQSKQEQERTQWIAMYGKENE